MLIDYLENASKELAELHGQMRDLDRKYRSFYDKNIREEIVGLKKSIHKKQLEISNELYRQLQELKMIKIHFPDLFNILLDDENIGQLIKKKLWLLEFKPLKPADAQKRLAELKAQRKQLRDAKDFLEKWVGKIDAKSLNATWPILKEYIENDMDKEEAFMTIDRADKQLRQNGWLILINDFYIVEILDKFLDKIREAKIKENEMHQKNEEAKGQGSTVEYDALMEYKKAQKARLHWERLAVQLLFTNTELLTRVKKGKIMWKNKMNMPILRELANGIILPHVGDKLWFQEMKQRIA